MIQLWHVLHCTKGKMKEEGKQALADWCATDTPACLAAVTGCRLRQCRMPVWLLLCSQHRQRRGRHMHPTAGQCWQGWRPLSAQQPAGGSCLLTHACGLGATTEVSRAAAAAAGTSSSSSLRQLQAAQMH